MYAEARSQVKEQGVAPPTKEAMDNTRRIRNARGENLTPEKLRQAKEQEGQQEEFMRSVKEIVNEKVKRGEGPSESRLIIDLGLSLPADWMIVKQIFGASETSEASVQNSSQ